MQSSNLAIMFTDISGYTSHTASQSRAENKRLLETHNKILIPIVTSFGGRHVKSIGDALLCLFSSPTDALLCAMAMQDSLYAYNLNKTDEHKIQIKIGINVGEVRLEKSDVFGDPVNVASRIQGLTPKDEIYFSDGVYMAMNKAEVPAQEIGQTALKGVRETVKLWKIPRFLSAKLVTDELEDSEDLAPIAFPFGGAHLNIPARKFELKQIMSIMEKHSTLTVALLFLIILLTAIVAFVPIRISNPNQNTKTTSEGHISKIRRSYGELTEIVASFTKESRAARDKLDEINISNPGSPNNDSAKLRIAIEEKSNLPAQASVIFNSEFETKVKKGLLEAQRSLDSNQVSESLRILDSLEGDIRKAHENIEFLCASTDQRIQARTKMLEYAALEDENSAKLPSASMAQKILEEEGRERSRGNYGRALKLLQKANEFFDTAIRIRKAVTEVLQTTKKNSEELATDGINTLINDEYEKSIVLFTAARSVGKDTEDLVFLLAQAYSLNNLTDEAMILLISDAAFFNMQKAFTQIGIIMYERQEYLEAKNRLEYALTLCNTPLERFQVYETLALACEGLKDLQCAVDKYRLAIELLENNDIPTAKILPGTKEALISKLKKLEQEINA